RPALTQCVRSRLGVDRAVPMGGKPAAGQAADTTLQATRRSAIAPLLAPYGVQPGASRSMAAAARVTADPLPPLPHPSCLTRPARRPPVSLPGPPPPPRACGGGRAGGGAPKDWEGGGVRAQTPPTQPRPGTCYTVVERSGTCSGQPSRGVGVPSRRQAHRRQP